MPELPEVELMARAAHRRASGAVVARLTVDDPTLWGPGGPPEDEAELGGLRVASVGRRGKSLVLAVGPWGMIIEPRMTGQLLVDPAPVGPSGRARRWRLTLALADGGLLRLDDPRRLARLHRLPLDRVGPHFAARSLGPEPWPQPRDGAWWAARFARARGPLKPALMRQDRVAGVGNIGASEACWRARVAPTRSAATLSEAEWARVGAGVHDWIHATLAAERGRAGGGGELHLVTSGGDNPFRVYGRAGEPCERCGEALAREVQAGRATFWCAGCQAS